jgi:hypothetical protein
MILHMAHLAVAAGGVDAFLIGSELVGLTRLRDEAGRWPFVEALIDLAADVRSVLGPATTLTYGADWSEWFGHHAADGSGDVIFNLDPLWAAPAIDAVGIDAWFPLTDWRRGDHLDAAEADLVTDRAHLDARVEGGENFDWYYASAADRLAQIRTPIVDGAHGEDWIFRRRICGLGGRTPITIAPAACARRRRRPGSRPRSRSGSPSSAVRRSISAATSRPPSPIRSRPRRGCPPSPPGVRDDFLQRRVVETVLDHWDPTVHPERNPLSPVTGARMIPLDGIHLWAWTRGPFRPFRAPPTCGRTRAPGRRGIG